MCIKFFQNSMYIPACLLYIEADIRRKERDNDAIYSTH